MQQKMSMSPEELRRFKGYENVTDEQATQIVGFFQEWAEIFVSVFMSNPDGLIAAGKAEQQVEASKPVKTSKQIELPKPAKSSKSIKAQKPVKASKPSQTITLNSKSKDDERAHAA